MSRFILVDENDFILGIDVKDNFQPVQGQQVFNVKKNNLPDQRIFCKYNRATGLIEVDTAYKQTYQEAEATRKAQIELAEEELKEKNKDKIKENISNQDAIDYAKILLMKNIDSSNIT